MNKIKLTVFTISLFFLISAAISAQDKTSFDELIILRDSAFLLEANIFAPKHGKKLMSYISKPKQQSIEGKNRKI